MNIKTCNSNKFIIFNLIYCIVFCSFAAANEIIPKNSFEAQFSLYLPNIGQGNCAVLSKADKSFVGIFDCGSISNRTNKWEEKVKPLLEQLIPKKKSKWLIVISHPDHDHYNFLPSIIEYIKPYLRKRDIQLTVVLGGMLEKYFYYLGNYSLIDTMEYLIKMNKYGVKIVSMSHEVNNTFLKKIINKTQKIKDQLKIPKSEIEELVSELIGDSEYINNAFKYRFDKEMASQKKELGQLSAARKKERIKEDMQKELLLSLKDRSNLLQKVVRQYFRDSYLSHPLRNNLRGYQENKNIGEFIGLKRVPDDITINVLSVNGGQSNEAFPPITVINDDENANSTVLQIVDNKTEQSILLPGDATGVTTDRVLSHIPRHLIGKIQYALASHHGADTDETNNREWIDVIRPKFVLFSASTQGNNFNHPRASVVTHYLDHADSGPTHDLTCFVKRNEREPDSSFMPFKIKKEFFDSADDKITIKDVNRKVYYSGDNNYFEGPLPFPVPII